MAPVTHKDILRQKKKMLFTRGVIDFGDILSAVRITCHFNKYHIAKEYCQLFLDGV